MTHLSHEIVSILLFNATIINLHFSILYTYVSHNPSELKIGLLYKLKTYIIYYVNVG